MLKRLITWWDTLPGALPLKLMATILAGLIVWTILKHLFGF